MSLSTTVLIHDVRTRLAHALGYHDYPSNATAEPYLTFIYKRHIGFGALEEWLELFVEVVAHFGVNATSPVGGASIQALIDSLVISGFRSLFSDTTAGHRARIEHVEDTVMYILGLWTTMLGSFVFDGQSRRITSANAIFAGSVPPPKPPYAGNLRELILGSGLLPGGRMDSILDPKSDTAAKLMRLLNTAPSGPNVTSQSVFAPSASTEEHRLIRS